MSRLAETFRTNLARRMRYVGMSKSELARRLQVTPQQVAKLTSYGEPGLNTVERVAAALDVQPASLLRG
jgi:transcriptional regulator with XRE-family HTH domain